MKERPILFSAPMVRALLAGTKTQTRRIVKVPKRFEGFSSPAHAGVDFGCPYGAVGDRLWVRETWGLGFEDGEGGYSAIPWTGADPQKDGKAFYRADFNDPPDAPRRPWRPSIHMPRWASRITLEITGVRVERLRDISQSDAMDEGVSVGSPATFQAVAAFRDLWESINGEGSWNENPFVWVVCFGLSREAKHG